MTAIRIEIKLNRVAKTIIRRALREDLGSRGDITSRACIPSDQTCEAVIIAKSAGIIAGQAVAAGVFGMVAGETPPYSPPATAGGVKSGETPPYSPPTNVGGEKRSRRAVVYTPLIPDGEAVEPGAEIARITGKTWMILAGERTALNILGRCCGIATLTRAYVDAVTGTDAKISETRKTAPGIRYLDKAAVRVGGGVNHRYALYDAFLIKENHVAAAGGITPAIEACRVFRERWGRFRIMVEARNWDEFQEALAAKPDRILLDNMTPNLLRKCVIALHEGVELEASGGITLDNVRDYAETGVDYISIGALTHSVKAMDLSLLMTNTND